MDLVPWTGQIITLILMSFHRHICWKDSSLWRHANSGAFRSCWDNLHLSHIISFYTSFPRLWYQLLHLSSLSSLETFRGFTASNVLIEPLPRGVWLEGWWSVGIISAPSCPPTHTHTRILSLSVSHHASRNTYSDLFQPVQPSIPVF